MCVVLETHSCAFMCFLFSLCFAAHAHRSWISSELLQTKLTPLGSRDPTPAPDRSHDCLVSSLHFGLMPISNASLSPRHLSFHLRTLLASRMRPNKKASHVPDCLVSSFGVPLVLILGLQWSIQMDAVRRKFIVLSSSFKATFMASR